MSDKSATNERKWRGVIVTFAVSCILVLCFIVPFVKPLECIDAAILKMLNPNCEHKFADAFMLAATRLGKNLLFWSLLLVWLRLRKGFKGMVHALFMLLLVVSLTDLLVGGIAKGLLGRPRPPLVEKDVRAIEPVSSSPSFPSAHAANWFAAAKTLSSFVPESKPSLFAIAVLVAYSRIYLGVHYPSDVVAGCIIGYMLALLVLSLGGRLKQLTSRIQSCSCGRDESAHGQISESRRACQAEEHR